MKLYVGCSLRHAPQSFKDSVEKLKDDLSADFEILRFLGDAGTPRDVFRHDIDCVRSCDAFLALCDLPSWGLGFEMATALSLHKPVLGVAHHDADVSRMILGIDNPNFEFKRYNSLEELVEMTRDRFLNKTIVQK